MDAPGISTVLVNQGGDEAQIGERGSAIPITIDGASGRYGTASADETMEAFTLFARQSASPYKAMPFFSSGAMTDITNTTNFICDVPDATRQRFAVGDLVKFYDVSAGAIDTGALTSIEIDIVSVAGGGTGGAGFTKITCTGEVFTNLPATADLLLLADGTELSDRVVLVQESIAFDGSTDKLSTGYTKGSFIASKVNNATYFVQADNQNLLLLDSQQ